MREFRGKRTDNGEWVEGYYFRSWQGNDFIIESANSTFIDYKVNRGSVAGEVWAVHPESVGQCTGLKAKKEGYTEPQDTFDGDIVVFGSQSGSTSEIRFIKRNGGFLVKDKYGDWQWLYDVIASTNCEIIGNKTDNPELLQ